jgi:quinoprotein glucose dehydrogenase
MTGRLLVVAVALAPVMSVLVAQAPAGGVSRAAHRSTDDWPAYGGGPEQTRYSTLTQINRANIGQLQVAWQFDPREGQIRTRRSIRL